MKPKIFIDGKDGTTGLQIYERLQDRDDMQLLLIDEDKRKDPEERKKLLNEADVAILCLPDIAAVESVRLVENPNTRIIDASTAHRVSYGWVYGFAEMKPGQRSKIKKAMRVANPGCHATGFLATVAPLVRMGVIPTDYPLTCFSITGYSGGGKKMIAEYENPDRDPALKAPGIYALNLEHKHLPEMQYIAGLDYQPVFSPILGDIYKGMATTVCLHNHMLPGNPPARAVWEMLCACYGGQPLIKVAPFGGETPRLYADSMAGNDGLEIVVTGHKEHIMLTARFDNLGKGASGAAVQNLNLMLGIPETTGLNL